MESRCCADACEPNPKSGGCDPYMCYKRNNHSAECKAGAAPAGWEGTKLGGHNDKDTPKAEWSAERQGTSLFCFTVLGGSSADSLLVLNFKSKKLGICRCEGHAFIDVSSSRAAPSATAFSQAWAKVKQDGQWQHHDWTIKVRADTVFLPERLRWHIKSLRTPLGSPVYLRNTASQPHLLGVLLVLTRQALRRYLERSAECDPHIPGRFGQDFCLMSCLEGLGIGYQSDYHLLDDSFVAMADCTSEQVVAFPMNEKVADWNKCHEAAEASWAKAHKGKVQQ